MNKQHGKKSSNDWNKTQWQKYNPTHSDEYEKIPNWKTTEHDVIHGFPFKVFTSIHYRPAIQINRYLQEANILESITKEKTNLI